MLEKQRQTLRDLEEEDDCQSTESIAELHKVICWFVLVTAKSLEISHPVTQQNQTSWIETSKICHSLDIHSRG